MVIFFSSTSSQFHEDVYGITGFDQVLVMSVTFSFASNDSNDVELKIAAVVILNEFRSISHIGIGIFFYAFFPTVYVFRLSSDHMFNSKIENFFKRSFQNGSHENGARVNNIEK